MSTDAQIAESSPAVETPQTAVDAAVVSNDVAAFREARRAERSGKPLDVTPQSSAAEPAEQAASTEVTESPASEPGKPRKNADTRVQELLADRARERDRAESLARRVAELEASQQPKPDAKTAPSPAPAGLSYPPELASYDAFLEAHPDGSYDDYQDARGDFRTDARLRQREAEHAQREQETVRSKAIEERDSKFREQVEAAKATDPAFIDSLSEEVRALKPFDAIRDAKGRWTEQPTGYHAIAEEIVSSPVAPQLMRHFSDHPEDMHRIAKLMPAGLLKEMGKLEGRFSDGAQARIPPKTVTDVAKVPTTLGTRPGGIADPIDAAVASGDMSAYRKARLAQRVAHLR